MQAYIAISYSERKNLQEAVNTITATLLSFNITPFIFVDTFQFAAEQGKEMMQQAMAAIDISDILIAETSHKAIGIGIEAGYAAAKNKPVIYIRHKNAEHSTTLSGISKYSIQYADPVDLKVQLSAILKTILQQCNAVDITQPLQ